MVHLNKNIKKEVCKMKEYIRCIIEYWVLLNSHKKSYVNYYLKQKKKVYAALQNKNIKCIRPIQRHEWKVWYNCFYYSGVIVQNGVEKKVFIKVMDRRLQDCFKNEKIVNDYIDQESRFLSNKKPALYYAFQIDNLFINVYDFWKMDIVVKNKMLVESVMKTLEEYNRIGIIHTDFSVTNIGRIGNEYIFFDYGTSLCVQSNNIRLRKGDFYNHIEYITASAKRLLPDADYYYDDMIHFGLDNESRNERGYIVASGDICYVNFGSIVQKYYLRKIEDNSNVYYLSKISE